MIEHYEFKLHAPFSPTGDQPQAIEKLTEGVLDGIRTQVLVGVTGSGKTFTMANVIQNVGRPALVIAHNKTLAAQLCNEFRAFFPENRVEYFVSYYDYYQPESYIPSTDTYIEKDSATNDEIDKLRNAATCSLGERDDVIVVSSVSCIYGLGAPEEFFRLGISLRPGQEMSRDELLTRLVGIQYSRNDLDFKRSTFRVRGDVVEIFPASNSEVAVRVEFFGDEIDSLGEVDVVTGKVVSSLRHAVIFPASHYAVGTEKLVSALAMIEEDLKGEVKAFEDAGKLLEAQRLAQRTEHDLEMLREIGYCSGVENYSRYFDGRQPGQPSFTLLDYFPKNFLVFIDESHMTIPQIRAMYNGDLARKTNLVEYGFRMKSAYDNRPLTFEEFDARVPQMICVSATPAPYELGQAGQVVEQLIRPTGLLDPPVTVKPTKGQIDDLLSEVRKVGGEGRPRSGHDSDQTYGGKPDRLLKRKRRAGALYALGHRRFGAYRHRQRPSLGRVRRAVRHQPSARRARSARGGARRHSRRRQRGLLAQRDLPRADHRPRGAQCAGPRHHVRRRDHGQHAAAPSTRPTAAAPFSRKYNEEHGIVPKTIVKKVAETIGITSKAKRASEVKARDIPEEIEKLKALMKVASAQLDFERAIEIRETIAELKKRMRK